MLVFWFYMINHTWGVIFHKGKQSYRYGYLPVKRIAYGGQQLTKIVYDTKQVRFI